MPIHPSAPPASLTARGRQRGIYALEWAIIFPVFFMLLYATLSFGLTFLVRESMQWSAEDGARAFLRYQPDRSARMTEAKKVVIENLGWLPPSLRPSAASININICHVSNLDNCPPTLTCGVTVSERCLIRLDFSIPYGAAPLTPGLSLFGVNLLNPDILAASASVLADHGGI